MTNSQRKVLLAPATADGVHIAAADTAGLNLDVDVVFPKRLRLELVLVEFGPGLGSIDLEAGELVWIGHLVDRNRGATRC